jgi:hypothetical protein
MIAGSSWILPGVPQFWNHLHTTPAADILGLRAIRPPKTAGIRPGLMQQEMAGRRAARKSAAACLHICNTISKNCGRMQNAEHGGGHSAVRNPATNII